MNKPASTSQPAAPASSSLAELERIERRFENALRDLRSLRAALQQDSTSRGVLGSRGLTQFLLEQLQIAAASPRPLPGHTVPTLMFLAEQAGYSVPTARTLSKRLTERAYRAGDITFDQAIQCWCWVGKPETTTEETD